MFFAAGAVGAAAVAAGTALDMLSSLTLGKSAAAKTGVKQTNSIFDVAGVTSATNTTSVTSTGPTQAGALSPSTFNALLSAQDANGKASPSDALKSLFAQIDGNGDGKITKAEFEDKLGAGGTNIAAANNVFNKMDANGDGSVSLDEMATALKGKGGRWSSCPSGRWRRQCVEGSPAKRFEHDDHKQRWFDHDNTDVCRRIEGHAEPAGSVGDIDRRFRSVQSR